MFLSASIHAASAPLNAGIQYGSTTGSSRGRGGEVGEVSGTSSWQTYRPVGKRACRVGLVHQPCWLNETIVFFLHKRERRMCRWSWRMVLGCLEQEMRPSSKGSPISGGSRGDSITVASLHKSQPCSSSVFEFSIFTAPGPWDSHWAETLPLGSWTELPRLKPGIQK